MSDINNELGMLVKSLVDKKDVLSAVLNILAENKKAVDTVAQETKASTEEVLKQIATLTESAQAEIQSALTTLNSDYTQYVEDLQKNSTLNRAEIEKATKAQNDRAFKRFQTLIDNIKLPKDGTDGLNANPSDVVPLVMELIKIPEQILETPESIRNKLETLEGNERLDVSAIKGLADYFKIAKKAGKQMLVGGIRFFENLADVSILTSKKRADLIAQYNTTNNRWENGIALTVSTTQPSNPQVNDLWVDIN